MILSLSASAALPEPVEWLPPLPRKLGHFAVYALLGLLCHVALAGPDAAWRWAACWVSLALGAAVAGADETIQSFVPTRHGRAADVLIDLIGVAWAQGAIWVVARTHTYSCCSSGAAA